MLNSFVGIKINNYEKIFSFQNDLIKLENYLDSLLNKTELFWDSIPEKLELINNKKIGEIKFYKRGNCGRTTKEKSFCYSNGIVSRNSYNSSIIRKKGTEKEIKSNKEN